MKKHITHLLCLAVVSLLAVGTATAQEKKDGKPAEKGEVKKKDGAIPYNGKITAADAAAKTVTLSGEKARVLHITSETRITKDGQPATFADAKVGEEVGGQYREVDGKLNAASLRIGPAPAKKKKADGEKKDEKK
jgi:Cu/Ag efflux protein CusF